MKSPLKLVALAALLVAGQAAAQPHPPPTPGPAIQPPPGGLGTQPLPRKSDAPLPHVAVDCVLTAIHLGSTVHRTHAVIDVSFRVKGVKGGTCVLHPEAVQLTTGKSAAVGRLLAESVVDGQTLRPEAISDNPNPEKLFTGWTGTLAANEERKVDFRFFVEGETLQNDTDVDPPARVRVESRVLGPRILDKAAVTAMAAFEPGVKAHGLLTMSNPKAQPQMAAAAADGTLRFVGAYGKDDVTPVFEFRYDAAPPPAPTAGQLTSGLRVVEYLRDGIVRDLAAGIADKKDEKKVAAAWDQAYDVAFAASQSQDPIVAGLGVRTIAYLAGGLSPTATTVKQNGAPGDGIPVPDSVAKATAGVQAKFAAETGQQSAPSPATSHPLRSLLLKLGDPAARKKDADEGLKRLGKRVDDGKVKLAVGDFYAVVPVPQPPPGVDTTNLRVIAFGPRGPYFPGAEGHGAAPAAPLASRIVRAFVHRRGSRALAIFLGLLAFAGLGALLAARGRDETAKPA